MLMWTREAQQMRGPPCQLQTTCSVHTKLRATCARDHVKSTCMDPHRIFQDMEDAVPTTKFVSMISMRAIVFFFPQNVVVITVVIIIIIIIIIIIVIVIVMIIIIIMSL